MKMERSQRTKEIVQAALEREPQERSIFVDGACLGDPSLLQEVKSLLDSHEKDSFSERLPVEEPETARREPATPTPVRPSGIDSATTGQIGPYHIIREIGHGGMGVVYEAEQRGPIRRRVALKLIKWGMDTREVIARFESERQALALVNHPSIASVFDADATELGRPYFAMEFVQGIPITEYCSGAIESRGSGSGLGTRKVR